MGKVFVLPGSGQAESGDDGVASLEAVVGEVYRAGGDLDDLGGDVVVGVERRPDVQVDLVGVGGGAIEVPARMDGVGCHAAGREPLVRKHRDAEAE